MDADLKERIVYVPIDKIYPYKKNAKVHQTELEFLKNSIQKFGFRNPVIVDKNGTIIAGHGRRLAALELGIKEIPVIIVEDLTADEVKAYRLADNQTGLLSGWDFDILDNEIAFLKDMDWDMEDFGFKFDDVVIPEDVEEENVIDEDKPTRERTSYNIVVSCENESDRDKLHEELTTRGFVCRVA